MNPSNKHKAFFTSRNSLVCPDFEETVLVEAHKKANSSLLQITRLDPIPWYLHTMRHTYRAPVNQQSPWSVVKSFIRTSMVDSTGNHVPQRCIDPNTGAFIRSCQGDLMSPEDSLFMHYRTRKYGGEYTHHNRPCIIRDREAWKLFDQLKQRVEAKLSQLF